MVELIAVVVAEEYTQLLLLTCRETLIWEQSREYSSSTASDNAAQHNIVQ